jgi:hypothetical protein
MKKIRILLLLCLPLLMSGCPVPGFETCTFQNTSTFVPLTPGASYFVIYQYLTPIIIRQHTANSAGKITVASHGQPCTSLYITPVVNSNVSLSASPSSVDLPSPPSTVTITGQSFDTTYGMPEVQYYDGNGYVIGSVYATSVSGGGTSLQANVPDLSAAYSGTYQVKVTNKTSLGYYTHIVGSATMVAYGRDRLDSDGDGWYDDEDCWPYSPGCNCQTHGYCLDEPIY